MNSREQLINQLSQNLTPVKPIPNVNWLASIWFLACASFVVFITGMMGGIRPGVISQLTSHPRFLLETLFGLTAIYWVSLQAFRDAVPGLMKRNIKIVGFALLTLWLAQYVIGFVSPTLEPSTLGKRNHCHYETMLYSLPSIFAAWFLIRRLYPLNPIRTSFMASLAAGMLPALYMQLACMYEPSHILSFHIAPGLMMSIVGVGIALVWGIKNGEK